MAALRGHMLDGRLTAEEFDERLASAHRARTWADLDAVSMNLPVNRGSHESAAS
jgi:hypothetical protein